MKQPPLSLVNMPIRVLFQRRILALMTLILAFVGQPSFALIAPLQVKPGHASELRGDGVVTGGLAADQFSLIGIRSEMQSKEERLVLIYGDRFGQPWKQEPGFFHIALDRSGRRIVVALAQVHSSAVDSARLAGELKKSKLVASSEIMMDPFDLTVNLILRLKVPVQLKVSIEKSDRSNLILDLQPKQGFN